MITFTPSSIVAEPDRMPPIFVMSMSIIVGG
jgi:hypothetical protein